MIRKIMGAIIAIGFALGCVYMACGMLYTTFFKEDIQNDLNDLKSAVNIITELDKYEIGSSERCPRKAGFAKTIIVHINAKNQHQIDNKKKMADELKDWFVKNNWKPKRWFGKPAYCNERYIVDIVVDTNAKTNKLFSLFISHNDFWEEYNL